ncbi:hypothetical protein GCM10010168_67500 [Actinoplanes ianthinogenes]|uniref:Ig-like domain-containing protein n=1 Tax=Actinoplanes ianthinogenes TaxID=122358 RepID=A0ABM7LX59_9ACTN|nr:Ig-like domain-containing protein [Actinoplanes ianthinogenes]BCJ43947.1 hypothetical protein Aiant_46040 [Actinoplanes ianthinogenes]GGR39354.1 hypothetical protein GCM10010168_67500 [Actinoplanes ianthinogenes]
MSKTLRAAAVAALSGFLVLGGGTAALADDAGPTIQITSQVPGIIKGGDYCLNVSVTDPDGVDRQEIYWDGVLTDTPVYMLGQVSPEGPHTFEVRAWDKLGNKSTKSQAVVVDRSAPAVTWVSPRDGALVRGKNVWSTIRVSEGTRYSGWLENGHAVGPSAGTAPGGTLVAYLPVGRDGQYDVVWYVTDPLENHTWAQRTVTVDNTKPKLTVTKAPKNKAKVHGKVKVKAAASDRNGVAKVQLLINGKVVATDYRAGYSFTVNTKKYGKKFKVTLRAYDKAGNATTSSTRTWRR